MEPITPFLPSPCFIASDISLEMPITWTAYIWTAWALQLPWHLGVTEGLSTAPLQRCLFFWTFSATAFVSHGRQNDEALTHAFSYFLQYVFSQSYTDSFIPQHSGCYSAFTNNAIPAKSLREDRLTETDFSFRKVVTNHSLCGRRRKTYKNDEVYLDRSVFLITTFTIKQNSRNFFSGVYA